MKKRDLLNLKVKEGQKRSKSKIDLFFKMNIIYIIGQRKSKTKIIYL